MGGAGDVARSDQPRGTWESTGLPSGDDVLAVQFEELQRRHSKSELENASLRMQLVSALTSSSSTLNDYLLTMFKLFEIATSIK